MKIKSIIVGSLATVVVVAGTLIKINTENSESVYTPRSLENGLYGQMGYAQYMHYLKEDPATGKIDPDMVAQVRQEIEQRSKNSSNKAALGLNWVQMGPDNVGGRTRAVLVDKYNPNIVYAGSIAGGLFVSTDGTQHWTQVAGHQGINGENLAVSCITQTDNGRIFFGTGSDFETITGNLGGTPGFTGNGVYEYVPSTGQVLPVITNATAVPNNAANSFWSTTNAIASKGNRLYLGTDDGMVWADPDGSGNYPTTFGGWTNPIFITSTILEQGTCHDIDVASDGSMVVCFSNKVYTSNSDGVGSFTRVFTNSTDRRLVAAIAPTNPNVIYLLRVDNAGALAGLEISLDKGVNWDNIVPPGAPCFDPFKQNDCGSHSQGFFDACLAVDPSDWGRVLVGGVQLYEWKYSPGSNPIGGSWLKAANLFESITNPYYVHADKHTIIWPNANTVYIGSDGGVTRSIDGGNTWQERNLGYNVTTFFDVATAANGWFVGGAQDNGCQMFTYGSFGEITPLGTIEVSSGDGFDVAFSNLSGGIVYTTSQYGTILRSNGGTPSTFYDNDLQATLGGATFHTVIENWENPWDPLSIDSVKIMVDSAGAMIAPGDTVYPGDTIFAGDTIWYTSLTNSIQLTTVAQSNIILNAPLDSIMIQDPIQNKFAYASPAGVYLTKDAARLNAVENQWYRISSVSNALCFEFSPNGNDLYVGTASTVVKYSNLSAGNDSLTLDIRSGSSVVTSTIASGISGRVTGIAVDPNNPDNVIVTTSGYTNGNHVYRSTNATTGLTFTSIQGLGSTSLPKMPVYACEIDYNDHNKVILGTEWGVWTSDNAFAASANTVAWTDESNGEMSHVPVMGVEQQHIRSNGAVNSGNIYLGTHGRGFFLATDLATSIDENDGFADIVDKDFISDLSVYPNPINNLGTIEFNLAERITNATAKIYTLTGSLVKTINLGTRNKGNNKERINVSELSIGTYIISLEAGAESNVAKFIVTR
jgi:hypothetical protein